MSEDSNEFRMKPLISDTSPEAEKILIEGYRRMSIQEKFHKMVEMTSFIKQLQIEETRRRHPEASERELQLRVASRTISPDLMRKAFGWDPEKEGY